MSEKKIEKKDTYSYKGWLNSDNFLKRVFAVTGYYTLGSRMITAIFLVSRLVICVFVGGIALLLV